MKRGSQDEIARIDREAAEQGMSYGRYVMEEERKKHMKISKEKIEEIQKLISEGKSYDDIAAETGVSKTTVYRVYHKEIIPEGRLSEPITDKLAPAPKPRADKPDILRQLIGQAVETLRDAQGNDPDDCALVGKALGLLTAAEMMLEGNAKI